MRRTFSPSCRRASVPPVHRNQRTSGLLKRAHRSVGQYRAPVRIKSMPQKAAISRRGHGAHNGARHRRRRAHSKGRLSQGNVKPCGCVHMPLPTLCTRRWSLARCRATESCKTRGSRALQPTVVRLTPPTADLRSRASKNQNGLVDETQCAVHRQHSTVSMSA